MDKWNINAKSGAEVYFPTVATSMVELRARKGLMIKIHMIGKTNPGGVHVGMLRVATLLASSLVSPRGRAFDIGLKIL